MVIEMLMLLLISLYLHYYEIERTFILLVILIVIGNFFLINKTFSEKTINSVSDVVGQCEIKEEYKKKAIETLDNGKKYIESTMEKNEKI
jgi:hypothetical protein